MNKPKNIFNSCERSLSLSEKPPSLLYNRFENFSSFSIEQKNTYCAMYELQTVQKNAYGLGMTFCLQTANTECKTVTVTKIIGEGGFKKAALLDDGTVIMFPNVNRASVISRAYTWPITVDNEANTAKFLDEIDVPGLNRKKAYLVVQNNEELYELPVLHSDSFAQYSAKGWFIRDPKYSQSSFVSDKEKGYWEYDFKVWEEPIKPLVRDVAKLVLNGFNSINNDSGNIVLKENDIGGFEFHYFGFDFNGLTGTENAVPSEQERTHAQQYTTRDMCDSIASKTKSLIASIVYHSLYSLHLSKEENKSSREAMDFSYKVGDYFLTCDFIEQVVGESFHGYHQKEL